MIFIHLWLFGVTAKLTCIMILSPSWNDFTPSTSTIFILSDNYGVRWGKYSSFHYRSKNATMFFSSSLSFSSMFTSAMQPWYSFTEPLNNMFVNRINVFTIIFSPPVIWAVEQTLWRFHTPFSSLHYSSLRVYGKSPDPETDIPFSWKLWCIRIWIYASITIIVIS